jgi:hypothetical protein
MVNKIAPYELIRRDFEHLKNTEELNTSREIEDLIFIQSLEGRAHNGAGAFHKSFYVNTTIDDVVRALKLDPIEIKKKRQLLIDEIFKFVKEAVEGSPRDRLLNSNGEPFIRIPNFREMTVNPYEVLKGIYIGGLRDDPGPRKAAEEKYDITIGYGKCYPVNVEVMERLKLDGEILAHQEHGGSLEGFKKEGLIIAPEELSKVGPEKIKYLYIRHKLGPGQSDDGAFVAAGLIYNRDVALGVFLADAIDTLEKYVLVYEDQDDDLSYYIGKTYKELNISMEDVYEIAYLAAVPEDKEEETPDSSLRYFLSKDRQVGQCAFESHLNFIEGKPYFPMFLSYSRILSTDFYAYIRNKTMSLKNLDEVMTSEALLKGLEAPVEEFLGRSPVIVSPGVSLKDAIEKMRSSGAEFIVIQDEKGAISGVLSMNDLLRLMIERRNEA